MKHIKKHVTFEHQKNKGNEIFLDERSISTTGETASTSKTKGLWISKTVRGQKVSKEMMKKGVTTLVLIFFAMVMIFQKDAPSTELQFVRNMNETSIHGVANENPPPSQRDYLFQNEAGNDVYQGQITDGQRRTEVTPPSTENNNTIDNLVNPNDVNQLLGNTGILQTGHIYTGNMTTGIQIIQKTGTEIPGSLDCITPWKETITNKDFILAYAQRKDVNTICDIEKRVCTNGVLGGTFTQRSCQENVVYDYQKTEVLSYNQKILNEFIQPSAPVNAGATFDTQGKINTTQQPTNTRGTSNSPVTKDQTVAQTPLSTKQSCITPRGQTINHGQFVKAYKAPRGFIDLPCEVEIRACINGNLKGTFINPKCTFNNTSYADYLKAGSPTSNTEFLFFPRIKKVLRFGR
ncbi:MAG: hypothetical protein NT085_03820 [candidate division SR1 bacterium]|nr:hypothetical protein [candidate division SR1 bacterium]